jgi:4-diphosphocytidyl-2-C-methyl-D-erythritol kinase
LELNEAEHDSFVQTGITFPPDGQLNLCEKAVAILRQHASFPPVHIHLRKQIPVGAGLGGGSADASYTLVGLNELFSLGFSKVQLTDFAAQLGSDCPFFIEGGLQLATGRGEQLTKLQPLGLKKWLVLCNPGIHVSTAAAYAKVKPKQDGASIQEMLIENGIQRLINDFEHSVFEQFPEISDLKTNLKEAGAYYAAMSGSGSSVFALFNQQPILTDRIQKYVVFQGEWTL